MSHPFSSAAVAASGHRRPQPQPLPIVYSDHSIPETHVVIRRSMEWGGVVVSRGFVCLAGCSFVDRAWCIQAIEQVLMDKRVMLRDYFSLEINDDGGLVSIPLLLKGYSPPLGKLPMFLLRLGPNVCFFFSFFLSFFAAFFFACSLAAADLWRHSRGCGALLCMNAIPSTPEELSAFPPLFSVPLVSCRLVSPAAGYQHAMR
jgi:hypothetical protein